MSWVFRDHPGSEKVMEYERKVNQDLYGKYPCVGLCQYDRSRLKPGPLKSVILTHPFLILGRRIYRNFYFVPDQTVPKPMNLETEVQTWLDNVVQENSLMGEMGETARESRRDLVSARTQLYREWDLRKKMEEEREATLGLIRLLHASNSKHEEELLLYQGKLQSLASELVLAEERERRLIATELHDRIGQALALSGLKLEELRGNLSSPCCSQSLDEIKGLIEQTIQDTRSLIFEISPPILHELGFDAAVEWLAERVQERYGILVRLRMDGNRKSMGSDMRVILFRALRELLVNVVKHAKAKEVTVAVQRKEGFLQISVEDKGVGFDDARHDLSALQKRGFGLFSIQERLKYLGGTLEVFSSPGRGTRVTLRAPLKESPPARRRKKGENKNSSGR
jgi:signal transduction histidine kinase